MARRFRTGCSGTSRRRRRRAGCPDRARSCRPRTRAGPRAGRCGTPSRPPSRRGRPVRSPRCARTPPPVLSPRSVGTRGPSGSGRGPGIHRIRLRRRARPRRARPRAGKPSAGDLRPRVSCSVRTCPAAPWQSFRGVSESNAVPIALAADVRVGVQGYMPRVRLPVGSASWGRCASRDGWCVYSEDPRAPGRGRTVDGQRRRPGDGVAGHMPVATAHDPTLGAGSSATMASRRLARRSRCFFGSATGAAICSLRV